MDSSDNHMGFWERNGKTLSVLVGLALCIASYCLAYYKIISCEQAWVSTIEIVLAIIAGIGYERASSLKRYREAAVIINTQKLKINTQDVKIKELNTNIENKTTTIQQQNTEIQNKTAEIKKLKTQIQELSQRGGNGATMLQANNGGINILASPPGNAHLDKLREEGKKDRKERKWRPVTPGEEKYMQVISNYAPFAALYAYKSSNYIDEDDGFEKYDLIVQTQNGGRIEYYDSINKEHISSMRTPGEVYWDIMRITAKVKNVFSKATEVYPTPNEIDNQTVRESVKRELSDLLAHINHNYGPYVSLI